MINAARQIFSVLSKRQKREFVSLQILVIVSALIEVISAASISPFMLMVGSPELFEEENWLATAYTWSGASSTREFMVLTGIGVISILLFSSVLTTITLWYLSLFGSRVGVALGNRLFRYYLHKSWLFHVSSESSILVNKIASEANRVTNLIIQPLLIINAKLVLVIFLSTTVLLVNLKVSAIGITIFLGSYLVIYRAAKSRLTKHGNITAKIISERFRLMGEGLGGIKDTLLLGRQSSFTGTFEAEGDRLARSQAITKMISGAPRSLIELIAFGAIITLVIYFVHTSDGNLGVVLAPVAFYAMASFKLLPAFQAIYTNASHIKSCMPSLQNIRNDLELSNREDISYTDKDRADRINVSSQLELKSVCFTYPGKEKGAINDLSMVIPANKTVGIVGASGSGKSTLIDLILGLISPDLGDIVVDGARLDGQHLRPWQNSIGFVPQAIYLANKSILENIGFGLHADELDVETALTAGRMAHVDEFAQDLPQGYDTVVGERGTRLSGGQRQRIGIARALYGDRSFLVFDEATSALDNITERIVLDAIDELSGSKTILIVAHRFTTIENCDIIYLMENGRVIDQGNYASLIEKSSAFREMALSD
jgi:HlyD family secretion protein